MPATEQTWRDSKILHFVFGITSLAMLVTTLWMLAADHLREWKDVQRKFRDIETWTAQSRLDEQETDKFTEQTQDLENNLAVVRSRVPAPEPVNAFLDMAHAHGAEQRHSAHSGRRQRLQSRQGEGRPERAIEAKKRNEPRDELVKKHLALVSSLEDVVKKAKFDEDNRQRDLKFARADLDVARSRYSLGVDEGKSETELAEIQEEVSKIEDRVEWLDPGLPGRQDASPGVGRQAERHY